MRIVALILPPPHTLPFPALFVSRNLEILKSKKSKNFENIFSIKSNKNYQKVKILYSQFYNFRNVQFVQKYSVHPIQNTQDSAQIRQGVAGQSRFSTNYIRAQNDYFIEWPIACFLAVKWEFLAISGDIPAYDTWETGWPQAEVQQYGECPFTPEHFPGQFLITIY